MKPKSKPNQAENWLLGSFERWNIWENNKVVESRKCSRTQESWFLQGYKKQDIRVKRTGQLDWIVYGLKITEASKPTIFWQTGK